MGNNWFAPVMILIVGVFVASVYYVQGGLSIPVADMVCAVHSDAALGAWKDMLHLSHNAYFSWSSYPPLEALFPENPMRELLGQVVILFVGATLFFRKLYSNLGFFGSFAGSLLLCVSLLFLFGLDTVVLSTLSWCPWLLWALLLVVTKQGEGRRAGYLMLTLLISMQLAMSANGLALLVSAVSWIFVVGSVHGTGIALQRRFLGFLFVLCFLPSIAALFETPVPNMPQYPELAHIVPDDNVKGMIRPFVGPTLQIPVIERGFLKATLGPLSVALLLPLLMMFLTDVRGNSFKDPDVLRSLQAAFVLAVIVLLDSLFPDSFSQIAPLYVLSRIISDWSFYALTPVVAALAVFFLVSAVVGSRRLLSGVVFAALLFVLPSHDVFLRYELPPKSLPRVGILQAVDSHAAWKEFAQFKSSGASEKRISEVKKSLCSPSHNLVRRAGLFVLTKPELLKKLAPVDMFEAGAHLRASHNDGAELQYVVDGKPETKWSTRLARQTGGEWLHVSLNEPARAHGVALSAGDAPWDYPRGVRISISNDAPEEFDFIQALRRRYTTVVDIPSWQGRVEFTPEGYPYYGKQTKVEIQFPQEMTFRSMLIEQTAQYGSYEWAVAKLSWLLPQ